MNLHLHLRLLNFRTSTLVYLYLYWSPTAVLLTSHIQLHIIIRGKVAVCIYKQTKSNQSKPSSLMIQQCSCYFEAWLLDSLITTTYISQSMTDGSKCCYMCLKYCYSANNWTRSKDLRARNPYIGLCNCLR